MGYLYMIISADPSMEDKFVHIMKEQLREILCIHGLVQLLIRKMRILFGMAKVLYDFIKDVHDGKDI